MKNEYIEINIKGLLKVEKSEKKLLNAFKAFIPKRDNIISKLVILILCAIPSYLISVSVNTVELFNDIANVLLSTFVAIFGTIFTGYVFFQALLNKKLLITLVTVKDEKKDENKLEELNDNFLRLMMLYIVAILISLLLVAIVPSIPNEYLLFENILHNNILAGMLIEVYFIFSAELIWRIVSFVFNIYQLFNAYAISRIIEMSEADETEEE